MMPIYEYRCSVCGFECEYLQKVSDAPLTTCPNCGKETFDKLISVTQFQLKGDGWYVTDFKNKGAANKTSSSEEKSNTSVDDAKVAGKEVADAGATSDTNAS
jgi:putative FmdB family regulatory protein